MLSPKETGVLISGMDSEPKRSESMVNVPFGMVLDALFACGCRPLNAERQSEIYRTNLPFVGCNTQAAASHLEMAVSGKMIESPGDSGRHIHASAQG